MTVRRIMRLGSTAYTEERDKFARAGRRDSLQGSASGFAYRGSDACEGDCGTVVQDPVDA